MNDEPSLLPLVQILFEEVQQGITKHHVGATGCCLQRRLLARQIGDRFSEIDIFVV